MHILVCLKQVLDPDGVNSYALWGRLTVDQSGCNFETGGAVPRIVNAYDEQAVEVALRLKDADESVTVTIASVGANEAATMLRRAIAMGADRAIEVQSDDEGTDGFRVASVLAGLVTELGDVDLVVCGRQGSDFDQGTVPAVLAEKLDRPFVTMASGTTSEGDALRVTRVTPFGDELVEVDLPAVIAVSNEVGTPRYPSSRRMMAARRTPPEVMQAADLASDGTGVKLVELFVPQVQGHGEIIEGDSPGAKAATLLKRLVAAGVLDG